MKRPITVVFNASVLLSAFHSANGGSAQLIRLLRKKQFTGVISETILDEVLRHSERVRVTREKLQRRIHRYFPIVQRAPTDAMVHKWRNQMLDDGDAHLFATCEEVGATHLVSLDKHHVLILQGKIRGLSILSPGEFLAKLKQTARHEPPAPH